MITITGDYLKTVYEVNFDPHTGNVTCPRLTLLETLYRDSLQHYDGHVRGHYYVSTNPLENPWAFVGVCQMFMQGVYVSGGIELLPLIPELGPGDIE